ncbi:ACT domain-containing protein [Streptomyces sp. NPDC057963]|uniref:ACT domain-containing protein n=1 Tax=Streptomyces sp. NPDC057963 TaxID=3346290 RepID=UPI0036E3E5A4
MLRKGRSGRARISGKHGPQPERFDVVTVVVGDQPGELARLFAAVDRAGVNIEDVRIEHATSQLTGLVHVSVAPGLAVSLKEALQTRGWRLH